MAARPGDARMHMHIWWSCRRRAAGMRRQGRCGAPAAPVLRRGAGRAPGCGGRACTSMLAKAGIQVYSEFEYNFTH